MVEKDICEKTLESYNDVFADIVNGLLFQGRQVVKEDELESESETSVYKADDIPREQRRDVAKYWRKGKVRFALFGLENQTDVDKDMVLRVLNYDGAAYRAQLNNNDGRVYPVVTLVLYFGDGHWKKHRSLIERLDIPEKMRPYVSDYKINVFEICHLSDEEIGFFRSDFKIVAHYFVHRKDPGYHGTKDVIRHVDEFFTLMRILTKDKNFENCYNLTAPGKGGKDMDDFLTRLKESGRQEGLVEGKKVGIIESKAAMVQQAMKNGSMTVEQLSVLFNMPVEEVKELSQMKVS